MNVKDFDAVIFDLDGTIYNGAELIDGAKETVYFFRSNDVRVFFGTNNSSKTMETICKKLNNMGVSCSVEEIVASGYLASIYCANNNIQDVYVFGSNELIDEFSKQNIAINQTEEATNLVIGYDKEIDYNRLTVAFRVAINARNIIACNVERNYPGDLSKLYPSCGAMVKAIEWCAKRECTYIIGKPNPYMINYIRERFGLSKNILVIGDSKEFDVDFANSAEATSICIQKEPSKEYINVKSIKDIPVLFE